MTYRDLLSQIQNLTEEQLNREVLVYNQEDDLFHDDGTELRITDRSIPGFIDANFPYLVI